MGHENLRVFTCDRCDARETKDAQKYPSWQPIGWGSATFIKPPLAGLDADGVERLILCPNCYRDARNFAASAPAQAVSA